MKTLDDYLRDWESNALGFCYGDEYKVMGPLKRMLMMIDRRYDYQEFEAEFGELSAWLMINLLCHEDIFEYGTSPRFGWLTEQGEALRDYLMQTDITDFDFFPEDYIPCYPHWCNCSGDICSNPFWKRKAPSEDGARGGEK